MQPLKAPDGPPHDLGQFYILIDPGTSDVFADRLSRIATAIAEEDGARIPGAGRKAAESVELADALWSQVLDLAGRK